jgi:hypothetical protein
VATDELAPIGASATEKISVAIVVVSVSVLSGFVADRGSCHAGGERCATELRGDRGSEQQSENASFQHGYFLLCRAVGTAMSVPRCR